MESTASHYSRLSAFVLAYIEAMLWVGMLCGDSDCNDCGSHGDDYSVEDIAPDTMAEILRDCENFQASCGSAIDVWGTEQAGHDFYLTRNGHGAGFWDRTTCADASFSRESVAKLGKRLTDAAHVYGSFSLYVGDDGKLYGMNG